MTLAEFESLAQAASRKARRPCGVGSALEALSATEADALREALKSYAPGVIRAWLEKRGLDASTSSIATHKHGKCKCYELA